MDGSDQQILLIENGDVEGGNFSCYLSAAGYQVLMANDFDSGRRLLAEQQPQLVLCDLDATGLGSEQALAVLSSDFDTAAVIVMSSVEDMDNMAAALRLGIADYLIKPITNMEMGEHVVRRCLEQAQLQRANLQHREQLERANQKLLRTVQELENDQQAGRYVQLKMLPATPKTFGDYRFSHQLFPSLLLSGDFVDYFAVGDRYVVFFIADVSGHGASSAFVTVLLKNMFARKRSDFYHHNDNTILSPLAMLNVANSNLINTEIDKHATLCVGVIDLASNQLRYSVAGHLPLPILSVNGQVEYLPGEGMPVGLFEAAEFSESLLQLPESFVLTLFTDGILEVVAAEGVLQQEQFLLARLQGDFDSVEPVLLALELDDISDAPDDITVLVISKKGR